MSKIFVQLIFLFFANVLNAQKISKLSISSVQLNMTSTFTVSCNSFEESFLGSIKQKLIKEPTKLKQVDILLSKFKSLKLKRIDVRGKLIIYYKERKRRIICLDEFGHFSIDGLFFENKKLFNFLLSNKYISEDE
jgi:hypothetical protein